MFLKDRIRTTEVKKGEVALFYLAQAGFCIKTADNKIIIVDAYLSDACERLFNFKRMMPSVIQAEELDADLYLSTHEHADHLDPDALPVVIRNNKTFFVGSPDCEELYKSNGLAKNRYMILRTGEQWNFHRINIRAIFADHGALAPNGVGLLITVDGISIYHTGDTCFKPEEIKASLKQDVDILLAPINGQYGNMNAPEACKLSVALSPKIVIPMHFWMFLEHVSDDGLGDPATFVKHSRNLPPHIKPLVMAPGELLRYSKTTR